MTEILIFRGLPRQTTHRKRRTRARTKTDCEGTKGGTVANALPCWYCSICMMGALYNLAVASLVWALIGALFASALGAIFWPAWALWRELSRPIEAPEMRQSERPRERPGL